MAKTGRRRKQGSEIGILLLPYLKKFTFLPTKYARPSAGFRPPFVKDHIVLLVTYRTWGDHQKSELISPVSIENCIRSAEIVFPFFNGPPQATGRAHRTFKVAGNLDVS